jgi:hypothetical protein
MRENVVKIKSFDFALRVIKVYQYLIENKKEFILVNNYFGQEHRLAH